MLPTSSRLKRILLASVLHFLVLATVETHITYIEVKFPLKVSKIQMIGKIQTTMIGDRDIY